MAGPTSADGGGAFRIDDRPTLDVLRRLRMVLDALSGDVGIHEALEIVLHQAVAGTSAMGATVAVRRDDHLEVLAAVGFPAATVARYQTMAFSPPLPLTDAVATGRPVWLTDLAERDRRYPTMRDLRTVAEATASLPIQIDGEVRAALGVGFAEPHRFGDGEREYLCTLAAVLGRHLERAEARRQASLDASHQLLRAVSPLVRSPGAGVGAEVAGALLDAALAEAPVGFALIDRERRFVCVNLAMARLNGLPVADHVGREIGDVVPDVARMVGPYLRQVLDDGETVVGRELSGPNVAGRHAEVLASYFPVTGPGVEVEAVGVLVVDVTERNDHRRQFEQAVVTRLADQERLLDRLQRSLLPSSLPSVPGFELDARYLSADDELRVGGDWYDAFWSDDRLVLVVGDAVGHGTAAIDLMNLVRNALRAYVAEGRRGPEVLAALHRVLRSAEVQMATAVIAELDPHTGAVAYTSAGHPPPAVRRVDGTVELLPGGRGVPLGSVPVASYPFAVTDLEPGDALVLYTDGLVERRTESLDDGLRRLRETLGGPAPSASRLNDRLVRGCLGSLDRLDDVCMLTALGRSDPQPPTPPVTAAAAAR